MKLSSWTLSFLFSLTSLASPTPQIPDDFYDPNLDPSSSRLYQFNTAHCTPSQDSILQTLFQGLPGEISSIIGEVNLGMQSTYGYSAFFKTDANKGVVSNLFQKIANKEPVSTGVVRYPILFICVNEGDHYTGKKLAYYHAHPDVPAASSSTSNDIFLFPLFWEQPRMPNARCPSVINGVAAPNDGALVSSQWGILVHELADKYLHFGETRVERVAKGEEVYNVQDCIELSTERQVWNAQNYAMFASAYKAICRNWTG